MSTLDNRILKTGFDLSAKADRLLKDHSVASVCALLLTIGAAFFISASDSSESGPEAIKDGSIVVPFLSVAGYFGLRCVTLVSKLCFRAEYAGRQNRD